MNDPTKNELQGLFNRRGDGLSERSDVERRLERRIRFLLPPLMAVYVMLGPAMIVSDFLAMHQLHGSVIYGFAWIVPLEIALLANIVSRQRAVTKLKRLQSELAVC